METESFSDKQIAFGQQEGVQTVINNNVNGALASGFNLGFSQAFLGFSEGLYPVRQGCSTMVSTTSTPTPTTSSTSSFYLIRDDPPAPSDANQSGSSNLLVKHGLEETYQKFCGKKVKESLSSFLPHLPGMIDEKGTSENSLRSVIDKPPIGGKELLPLQGHALSGFRLNPGPIPEQFRFMSQQPVKKKHKHKRHKKDEGEKPRLPEAEPKAEASGRDSKKQKKQKKHDEGGERKKKKKEKKKKKRHTPDPSPVGDMTQGDMRT